MDLPEMASTEACSRVSRWSGAPFFRRARDSSVLGAVMSDWFSNAGVVDILFVGEKTSSFEVLTRSHWGTRNRGLIGRESNRILVWRESNRDLVGRDCNRALVGEESVRVLVGREGNRGLVGRDSNRVLDGRKSEGDRVLGGSECNRILIGGGRILPGEVSPD